MNRAEQVQADGRIRRTNSHSYIMNFSMGQREVIEAQHIAVIREQVPQASNELARRAYRDSNGDIVQAIMSLTSGDYDQEIHEEEVRRSELVREQVVGVTAEQARQALQNANGDIVQAIMSLTMGDYDQEIHEEEVRRIELVREQARQALQNANGDIVNTITELADVIPDPAPAPVSVNTRAYMLMLQGVFQNYLRQRGVRVTELYPSILRPSSMPQEDGAPFPDEIQGENEMEPIDELYPSILRPSSMPQEDGAPFPDEIQGENEMEPIDDMPPLMDFPLRTHVTQNDHLEEPAPQVYSLAGLNFRGTGEDITAFVNGPQSNLQGFVLYDSSKPTTQEQHSPEASRTPWTTLGEWTFYRAISAPEDWEDLYGEPFQTRDRVYAFSDKSQPDKMIFYSSEELIASFLHHEDFVNPKGFSEVSRSGAPETLPLAERNTEGFSEVSRSGAPETLPQAEGNTGKFTLNQINRLLRLAEGSGNVCQHPTPENPALVAVIRQVHLFQQDVMRSMKKLSSSPHFKEALEKIFKIGMIMRGWTGGEYPLRTSQTHGPVDHVKLSQELLELKGKLESDWVHLKGIRLVKYENSWKTSEMTLWERLQVVLQGSRVEACIRMTSGLFAQTTWFYLDAFFQEQPFNLHELENVA